MRKPKKYLDIMMASKNFYSKKGFTLIELVVVMAIIAILVALMITAIVAARQQANNTQITGNAKTIETALETWSAKNGGAYPSSTAITYTDVAATQSGGLVNWLKSSGGSTVLSGGPAGLLANQIYVSVNGGSNYTLVACSTSNTGFVAGSMPAPGRTATLGTTSGCTSPATVVYSTAR